MRVALLTREWPPEVYGGAGVHVEQLAAQLRALVEVTVHCFGPPRKDAIAHAVPSDLTGANPALQVLGVDLAMAAGIADADIAHSHTWYANLAGHVAAILHGIPHIVTAHSLEPLRPWKREQLGGGYELSSWIERTAYEAADAIIAVSDGMRRDVLAAYPAIDPARVAVVRNGIDTDVFRRDADTSRLSRFGFDPSEPYILFVGRITRQKGLIHLLRAAQGFEGARLVMCASSPDTPEIEDEVSRAVEALRSARGAGAVTWIEEQVDRRTLIQLYSHALAFACPSVYEPLGIVNLEAMACETAVVASAVGGIPEVVADGETGILVEYDANRPTAFEARLASAVNRLAADPAQARRMGERGRQRAVAEFGWPAIAARTVDVYREAIARRQG